MAENRCVGECKEMFFGNVEKHCSCMISVLKIWKKIHMEKMIYANMFIVIISEWYDPEYFSFFYLFIVSTFPLKIHRYQKDISYIGFLGSR